MKVNEQFFNQKQGSQRKGYLIKSIEKLKQIHKQKNQISQSKQINKKTLSNKKSTYNKQKSREVTQWNTSSESSNQSSVIILTPQLKHQQSLKKQNLPFLTQENEKSNSIKDLNNNVFLKKNISTSFNHSCKNNLNEDKRSKVQSYQVVSDEDKDDEQQQSSMIFLTEKNSNKEQKTCEQRKKNNYINLMSSENKIMQYQSNEEINIEDSSIYEQNNLNISLANKQEVKVSKQKEKILKPSFPLQTLEQNIMQNFQTPTQNVKKNIEKRLFSRQTPYSSIKKRLFDNQQDFLSSQQENFDFMMNDIQTSESDNKNILNSISCSSISELAENRQHIVKILEVVKVKNSSAKLAKVSVSVENATQLQIKYIHTFEIRQSCPELLIQYYEETFDSYFLEIQELF